MNEVTRQGDIESEHQHFHGIGMEVYLINFHWYERTREDYREPLRPTLQQAEADSLGQEEPRVKKASHHQILHLVPRKSCRLQKHATEVPAARANTELRDAVFENARDVRMKQLQSSEADPPEVVSPSAA